MFVWWFFFCQCTLFSNDILHWVTSEVIFSTDQPVMSLPNLELWNLNTCWNQLTDWSRYLTVFHMIAQSKMKESLSDLTSYKVMLAGILFCHLTDFSYFSLKKKSENCRTQSEQVKNGFSYSSLIFRYFLTSIIPFTVGLSIN